MTRPEGAPSPTRLSADAFAALLDAVQTVERPLGDVCLHLSRTEPVCAAPPLALSVSLTALLQDDLLPEPAQRLVALYMLYHQIVTAAPPAPPASSSASASGATVIDRLVDSPLSIVLFELQDARDARAAEQLFLSHLLSHAQTAGPDTPVPAQIAQAPAMTLWNALEDAMRSGAEVPKLNMSELRAKWTQRHPEPAAGATSGGGGGSGGGGNDRAAEGGYTWADHVRESGPLRAVSGVVRDPEADDDSSAARALAEELGEVATLEDFAPQFVRLPPPLLPITPTCTELRWVDPEPLHEVVWDPDMGSAGARGRELRDVVARALKTPIPEAQQARVLAQLEADPKLVHLCGLAPARVADLVRNNAELATKMLLKLEGSKQLPQYLSELVKMDINMHSIEVVNRLTSGMDVPAEFLHTFISNCTQSCAEMPDRSGQLRMVRIVCLFLRNLIRNKAIDPQDLSIEVQAFCIEYSRIREAADLFRSLKSFGAQQ